MTPLRSGFKSSEFWATMMVNCMAAYVVAAGRPTPQVVALVAIAAMKTAYYLYKRTELKIVVADPTQPQDVGA